VLWEFSNTVYAIQPVAKPVVQPVWCLFTRYSRLSNRLYNPFDNRLYTRYSRLSNRLLNGFDNRLNVCIHDTTGCQSGLTTGLTTGLTIGLTTGCIVYTNIYTVVKPVWQPIWQQVVSCKRGFTTPLLASTTCWLRSTGRNSAGACNGDVKTWLLQFSTDRSAIGDCPTTTTSLELSGLLDLRAEHWRSCYSLAATDALATSTLQRVELKLCCVMYSVFYRTCSARLTNDVESASTESTLPRMAQCSVNVRSYTSMVPPHERTAWRFSRVADPATVRNSKDTILLDVLTFNYFQLLCFYWFLESNYVHW